MLYARIEEKIRSYAMQVNPQGSFFYGNKDAFKSAMLTAPMPCIYLADILDVPNFTTGHTTLTLDFAFFGQDTTGSANDAQNQIVNNMLQLSNALFLLLSEDEELGHVSCEQRSTFYRLTEAVLSGVQGRVKAHLSLLLCN
jgi:hypothetical protein